MRSVFQCLGRADYYWHTGQPGPGGPDSEISSSTVGPSTGRDLVGLAVAMIAGFIADLEPVFMRTGPENVRSKTEF